MVAHPTRMDCGACTIASEMTGGGSAPSLPIAAYSGTEQSRNQVMTEVHAELELLSRGEDWKATADRGRVLHLFAAAHVTAAEAVMEDARVWVAADERRLHATASCWECQTDEVVRIAVEHGLDRRCTSKLIHAAAVADEVGIVRVLINCDDCIIDLQDDQGRTALHLCARNGCTNVASVLLDASASLEILCDPPHTAADSGSDDGMCDDVITRPAPSAPGTRTALHVAALHNEASIVQLLLDARADPAACPMVDGAVTPLHECAEDDAVDAARMLAAAAAAAVVASFVVASSSSVTEAAVPDADLPMEESARDEPGQFRRFPNPLHARVGHTGATPLHAAAENDAMGVVSALLEAGADPALGDDQGDTPVHCAVLYGSPRSLRALLESSADAMKENHAGELPLHLLAEYGPGGFGDSMDTPLAQLRRHFAKSIRSQELLVEALRSRSQLEAAMRHGANGECDGTPLHAAARSNHFGAENAVRLLVQARAEIDQTDADGRSALSVAILNHGPAGRIASVLRELGASEVQKAEAKVPELVEDALSRVLGGCIRPLVRDA